jgi:hypothetical protein
MYESESVLDYFIAEEQDFRVNTPMVDISGVPAVYKQEFFKKRLTQPERYYRLQFYVINMLINSRRELLSMPPEEATEALQTKLAAAYEKDSDAFESEPQTWCDVLFTFIRDSERNDTFEDQQNYEVLTSALQKSKNADEDKYWDMMAYPKYVNADVRESAVFPILESALPGFTDIDSLRNAVAYNAMNNMQTVVCSDWVSEDDYAGWSRLVQPYTDLKRRVTALNSRLDKKLTD